MGSIFSGTSTTSTPIDLTNYASKDYVTGQVTTQLKDYAKTSDLNTQVQNQLTSQLPTQLSSQLANYIKYNDNNKNSVNVNVNSDTDYFTLNDINNKQLAKFGKNTAINNLNSNQITVNNTNQVGIVLKNTEQQNTFAIQSGNDGADFVRLGQVILKPDGSFDTQDPFVRFDRNTQSKEMNTLFRTNVKFDKDINIGDDGKYYNISRDGTNMCLTLNYITTSTSTDANKQNIVTKTTKQIGKWCPPAGTL